jgi:hypothetical protein
MDHFLPYSFFAWCQAATLSGWINSSAWAFALVTTVHIAGLTVLLAGIVAVDLRLLGLMKHGRSVADVASRATPYIGGSLVVLVATGIAQFMARAVIYGHSLSFLFEILLLAIAIATHLTVVRKATGASELAPVRYRKLAAYLSLLSWVGVAVAERGVAVLP